MKKIMTYGTFDLLHLNSINILHRAKELGGHLTVAISTDKFNALKHKLAYYTFEHRKQHIEVIRYVAKVILGNTWNHKKANIKKQDIDIFVKGDDWKGEFDFLNGCCEILYSPRATGISPSKIKKDLHRVEND